MLRCLREPYRPQPKEIHANRLAITETIRTGDICTHNPSKQRTDIINSQSILKDVSGDVGPKCLAKMSYLSHKTHMIIASNCLSKVSDHLLSYELPHIFELLRKCSTCFCQFFLEGWLSGGSR